MLSLVIRQIKGLYEFHLLNPGLACLNWAGAALVAAAFVPHALNIMLTLFLFSGLCSAYLLFRLSSALDARIAENSTEPWVVEVNGVPVGTLLDAQVALMEREIALDPTLYVRQALNALKGLGHATSSLVTIVPTLCFWLSLAALLLDPEGARGALAMAATASPEQLRDGMVHLGQLIGLVAFCAVALIVATSTHKGNALGFENQFSAALVERVRRAVECAAKGEVLLTRRGIEKL